MSYMKIGRLVLGPPWKFSEAVGDPVSNLGGAPIPAPRQALRHMVDIGTISADGYSDTLAQRLVNRRQLRSMLNNLPLKLQGYIYVIYSDDPEQNGWYVPDFGQFSDIEGSSGLATGAWQLQQVAWLMAGHKRINAEARNIWMKDLRTGLNPRDALRLIYSTDFSSLSSLALSPFPHGAVSIRNAVSGQVPPTFPLLVGRDGGTCQIVTGQADLACLSYERPDSAWGLSDVIVYDRLGANDAPSTGPGATWIEAYGSDFAWSWTSSTPVGTDTPVLDNGLLRVRWSASNTPGFILDVWNGSAYAEQGKMILQRRSTISTSVNTWISASMIEYTFDRAMIKVVMASSGDSTSRETVYITLQRGKTNVIFEAYPAPRADGTPADAVFEWAPAQSAGADSNESFGQVSTLPIVTVGHASYLSTAGTGAGTGHSGLWQTGETVLSSTFANGENWLCILRCPTAFSTIGPYQTVLSVVQVGLVSICTGNGNSAYSGSTDSFRISSGGTQLGYIQTQVGFNATVTDQIMEAESMTLGTNTTTASDALASGTGNNTTQSTRTSDANPHVSRATWPNSFLGTFRVFARVKTSASTLHIYAKTGATTGSAITTTSNSYTWLDLGEVVANGTTLEIHCWATAAATVSVDRIEAILAEDRTRTGAIYTGARDQGQAALNDSRMMGAVVAR